jgi:hypothetical protein
MKKLFLFLIISFSLQAQSDSLKVTFSEEKVEKFEKTTLIDEYEKAFGGNRVVKSGLRMRVSEPQNLSGLILQYEQKIGTQFSIIGSLIGGYSSEGGFRGTTMLEGRMYYNMWREKILKNKQPNITGNFIALRLETTNGWNQKNILGQSVSTYNSIKLPGQTNYSIIWGRQFSNILEYGLQIGVKKINPSYIDGFTSDFFGFNKNGFKPFISTQSQVGIGILFPKRPQINGEKCEFLRCNYEQKKLFKLNLNNAIYFEKNYQTLGFDGAFEHKLGQSKFSSNTNLNIALSRNQMPEFITIDTTFVNAEGETINGKNSKYTGQHLWSNTISTVIREEIRYYFFLNEKTYANPKNLNGYYFKGFTEAGYTLGNETFIYNAKSIFYGIGVGYQTLASKSSYLDISAAFGISKFSSKFINNSKIEDYADNSPRFQLSIKLGLAK